MVSKSPGQHVNCLGNLEISRATNKRRSAHKLSLVEGSGSGISHLRDAPLGRDVEAVLRRREALHLQDFGGDGERGEKHTRTGLFEAFGFIYS